MLSEYSPATRKFLNLTLPPLAVSPKLYHPVSITLAIAAGLAIAWLPLKSAVLLVGGVIFLILALINPTLSLYILIPIIPFSSLLALPAGGFKIGLMEVVVVLALATGLLKIVTSRHLTGRPFKLKTGPLLWPFVVLLGGVSLSWLNALSVGASLIETVKWVEMFVLYLFILNLFPARHIKWLVLVFIATGMAQALLGLYQFIYKVGPEGFLLFNGTFLRAYGTFAQPNPYAGYLGLLLPLVLSLTVWGFGQIRESGKNPKLAPLPHNLSQKIFKQFGRLLKAGLFGLPLGLLLAALFASQSRGAWLGFTAAGVVTLVVRSKKSALIVATLALIGASVGLTGSFDLGTQTGAADPDNAYTAVIQRLADTITALNVTDVATTPVTDANFATLERLAHWQAAREMWRDNPWLGVGFGNYAVIYPAYAVGRWLDPLGHAHNYLLNVGAETGLIGITAYLIFWIFTFGLLWVIVQRSDGFNQAVAAGGMGIIVHLHIHNLVDNLYVQGMYLHIAIILGLVSVIYQYDKKSRTTEKTGESFVFYH